MARKTVTTNMLTPNAQIMVRGKVAYSHITKHVDGDELKADIQRRTMQRRAVINKPYTTITIYEAQVVYANPQAATNPALKRPEEIYMEESMYKSNGKHNSGLCLTRENKSPRLPWVAERRGNQVVQLDSVPGELAAELDVTLVLRVFSSAQNNGVSLDGVIVNEPVRFFSSSANPDLSGYGLEFVPAAPAVNTDLPGADAAPMGAADSPFATPGAPVTPAGAPGAVTPAAQPGAAAAGQGGINYDPTADPARQQY